MICIASGEGQTRDNDLVGSDMGRSHELRETAVGIRR